MNRRTPLKRGKPLRRRRRTIQYSKVRRWVEDRAEGRCEARIAGVCAGRGCHAHHLLPRSAGRDDSMGNLVWVCQPCHQHIHHHPAWAYEHGWLRRRAS